MDGEIVLNLEQRDELDLRIGFLSEVFSLLFETRTTENVTLANFDILMLESCHKLDEIKAILNGKDIIGRDENSVFGMN